MDAGTVDVEHQNNTNEGPLPTLIPTMTEEQLKELREELPPIIMMEFKDDTPILAVEAQASIEQEITLFPEGPELPPLGNLLSEMSEGQFKPLYEGSLISEPPVPETGLNVDPGTHAIPQTPAVASALHGLSMQLISTNHHLINVGTQVNNLADSHQRCCTSIKTVNVEKCWTHVAMELKNLNGHLASQNSALITMNQELSRLNNANRAQEDRFVSAIEGVSTILAQLAPLRPFHYPAASADLGEQVAPPPTATLTSSSQSRAPAVDIPPLLPPAVDANKLQHEFQEEWSREKESTRSAIAHHRHIYPLADSPLDHYTPAQHARRTRGNGRNRGGRNRRFHYQNQYKGLFS